MSYILKTTTAGLIYIWPSRVINVKKPNATDGAKILGKPVIVNVNQIGFLSFNVEGKVTFFMANGFEISMNVPYDAAEEALNCAKEHTEKTISG